MDTTLQNYSGPAASEVKTAAEVDVECRPRIPVTANEPAATLRGGIKVATESFPDKFSLPVRILGCSSFAISMNFAGIMSVTEPQR